MINIRKKYLQKYIKPKENKIFYTFNNINKKIIKYNKNNFCYLWKLMINNKKVILEEIGKLAFKVISNKKLAFYQLKKYNNIYYSFYKYNPKILII